MDGTFIQALAGEMQRPVVVKQHGHEVLCVPTDTGAFHVERIDGPLSVPEVLNLSTLTGLVDYIKGNRDVLPLGECVLQVVDHHEVALRSKLTGEFAQRFTYAKAIVPSLFGSGFSFGQWMQLEEFICGLQSLFVANEARDAVLTLVSGLKDGEVRTHEDNGIAQAVTARTGVARVGDAMVPNPITLRPFRTFRDLEEQPASLFVLRLKSGSPAPSAILFEADGGAWKLEAIRKTRDYLSAQLTGTVAIIA